MAAKLTILAIGLSIVNVTAGPLDRAASLPESLPEDDFLSQFLGKVDEEDPSPQASEPILPLPLESDNLSGKAASPSYGDGYDDDKYDDDEEHDDHYYDEGYDVHQEDPYYATSLFCRMVVYPYALNPDQCSKVKIKDYNPDFIYDATHKTEAKGKCYWDRHLGKIDQQSGCMCPRPKKNCHEKKQCYWHVLPNPGKHEDDKKGYDDYDDKEDDYGHCIHNSERFYNLLANLLKKRGKKDLSLQIEYSSVPAKGKLPYGPYGPAVIGNDKYEYPGYPYSVYSGLHWQYPYQPAHPSESTGYSPYSPEPQEYQPIPYGTPDPYPSPSYQEYDHQGYPSDAPYPVQPVYPSPCQQPYYMSTPSMIYPYTMPYFMGPGPYQSEGPYQQSYETSDFPGYQQAQNFPQYGLHVQNRPFYDQAAANKESYDMPKPAPYVEQLPTYQPPSQGGYGYSKPQTYRPPAEPYGGYQRESEGYAEVNHHAQQYSQQNYSPDPNPYNGHGVGSSPNVYVI